MEVTAASPIGGALEQQVQDKNARLALEKAEDRETELGVLAVTQQLKLVELERQHRHLEARKEVADFNQRYLNKEDRREYDLSDPHSLRKQKPPQDGEIGVSSAQRFVGEDTRKSERTKAQQAQQRAWLLQQAEVKRQEKAALEGQKYEEAEALETVLALRKRLEVEENELRQNITKSALSWNEVKREQDALVKGRKRSQEEQLQDTLEMQNQAKSELLNESGAQYNGNGKIRRDHFRGLTKEEVREAMSGSNAALQRLKAEADAVKREEDLQIDRQAEMARRALVMVDRERASAYADIVSQEMHKNYVPTAAEKREMNRPYRGSIGNDFFKGFGTSSR